MSASIRDRGWDLVVTLRELTDLGVGLVSLNEALALTTPTGQAFEKRFIGGLHRV
jgi:hypothetical protein